MPKILAIALVILTAVTGCAAEPFAKIDGLGGRKADFERSSVRILAVDGQAYFDSLPFRDVEPGVHTVTFLPVYPGVNELADRQTIVMDFKPCIRYTFYASTPQPRRPRDWTIKQGRTAPISGCDASRYVPNEVVEP
ncbi:MAG: hypothetical protein AB8F65_06895 [Woeseiaceae bacterium]